MTTTYSRWIEKYVSWVWTIWLSIIVWPLRGRSLHIWREISWMYFMTQCCLDGKESKYLLVGNLSDNRPEQEHAFALLIHTLWIITKPILLIVHSTHSRSTGVHVFAFDILRENAKRIKMPQFTCFVLVTFTRNADPRNPHADNLSCHNNLRSPIQLQNRWKIMFKTDIKCWISFQDFESYENGSWTWRENEFPWLYIL